MDYKPFLKGARLRHVTRSKFWELHLYLKFCTKGDYIKSCQRDKKNPPKRGVVLLIYVCTTVELEKILHATRLSVINNVVDDGLLLITPTALQATLSLRPKSHRFDLHCICAKLAV